MTAKQAEFCRQYLIDYNATQAYIRAGYAEKGASVSASKMLGIPKVQRYIAELQAQKTEQTGITAQRVIDELAKVAFADMADLVDESNDIRNISDLDRVHSAAITSFSTDTITTYDKEGNAIVTKKVKVGTASKVEALEKLAKHLGLYERDNSQKSKVFKVTVSDE